MTYTMIHGSTKLKFTNCVFFLFLLDRNLLVKIAHVRGAEALRSWQTHSWSLSPLLRARANCWAGRHQITPSHVIPAFFGLRVVSLSSDLTDKECEGVRLARLACCMSTVSLHFTDYPNETLICSNSVTSYRVNVSVRMLFRPGCQYPQQSDRKHPAIARDPRGVAIEALHHGSPSCGPRPHFKFI